MANPSPCPAPVTRTRLRATRVKGAQRTAGGQGHPQEIVPNRRAALRESGRESRREPQRVLGAETADGEGLQDNHRSRAGTEQGTVQEAEARLLDAAEGTEP